jgi:ribulose kinase
MDPIKIPPAQTDLCFQFMQERWRMFPGGQSASGAVVDWTVGVALAEETVALVQEGTKTAIKLSSRHKKMAPVHRV